MRKRCAFSGIPRSRKNWSRTARSSRDRAPKSWRGSCAWTSSAGRKPSRPPAPRRSMRPVEGNPWALRPTVTGTRHAVVTGHHLAAQAGLEILEAGGNAVDAGVAAGIAMAVLHPDQVNFAGVAPMLIYLAARGEVVAIDGLGVWPKRADREVFAREHGGHVPPGILRTVVPAAPDAWITALERYGTMSFGQAAGA